MLLRTVLPVLATLVLLAPGPAAASPEAWAELAKPGAVVLFRHATAPGIGDPEHFDVNDCRTQRNLDETGRAEARRLGEQFRQRGIRVQAVLTSQWCRARDTARLAFGEEVREEPAFNSFFRRPSDTRDTQTERARALIAGWRGPGVLVVVTHQVNIQALAGVSPASGEGVVVRPGPKGQLQTVGTLSP